MLVLTFTSLFLPDRTIQNNPVEDEAELWGCILMIMLSSFNNKENIFAELVELTYIISGLNKRYLCLSVCIKIAQETISWTTLFDFDMTNYIAGKQLMLHVAELVPRHPGRTKKQEPASALTTAGPSKSGKGGKKKR